MIFVPHDFDADNEDDRLWLRSFLGTSFSQDIAFGIVFGGLSKHVLDVFIGHNGPFGLKYAVLHEIVQNGLTHTPTFKESLGYKTDGPIREAIAMLNAAGLVRRWSSSVCCFPTIRGRFLLDFTRRLLLDVHSARGWSLQTMSLFNSLGVAVPEFPVDGISSRNVRPSDRFGGNLLHASFCNSHYGRNLLADVDLGKPVFYSQFIVEHFVKEMALAKGFSADFFSEPEYLFVPNMHHGQTT